jgi:hypothetical protein
VLVPIGAALGTTDEVAELAGHGPLDPDDLAALLTAAPEVRAVWVDENGVPVAVADRAVRPGRDPAQVRRALLDLADQPPPDHRAPRHPNDHRPEHLHDESDDSAPAQSTWTDDNGPPDPVLRPPDASRLDEAPPDRSRDARPGSRFVVRSRPVVLSCPHPVGRPGPYRVPAALRRLLQARAPRCEWPGCGARAVVCDLDHDLAWPAGPTCGCDLGPGCRRHHRIKQLGWTKTRLPDSTVAWTSPTGRTWTSPSQHDRPAAPVRPLPPLPTAAAHDRQEVRPERVADEAPDDPSTWPEPPPEDHDRLAARLLHPDAAWDLDLQDATAWSG